MNAVQINSMPALIAWFSICLLAAATGRLLDDRWQIIWAELGAFGLVAAVGLGSLEKVRAARDLRARDRNLQTRLESGLDRLNDHSATLDSINVAVRRLTEHVAKRRRARTSTVTHAAERSWETELLAYYPVEILPLEEEDSTTLAHREADCRPAAADFVGRGFIRAPRILQHAASAVDVQAQRR